VPNLNRRDFLKALGVGSATSTLAACGLDTNNYKTPVELVLPYVVKPDQVTPGTPTFFATTVARGPHARPVVARHRDGRVIFVGANRNVEGRAGVASRDFFELQRHYSPDRLKAPVDAGQPATWDAALPKLAEAVKAAKAAGQKVVYLGGYKSGAIVDLLNDFTGGEAIFWEPVGYEAEVTAAAAVFGRRALPFYRLDQAQYLLSFGAPFLSGSWGDPEIESRWASARNPNQGGFVARFTLVAPYRDQTGANADDWFACAPGTEVQVARAIASLAAERAGATAVSSMLGVVDVAGIASASGVDAETLKSIAENLVASRGLVLPGGAAGGADLAAATYLINVAIGAAPSRFHLGGYQGPIDGIDRLGRLVADLNAGTVGVLLIDDANPVYALPDELGFAEAAKKAGLVVGLSSHPDETQALASLVLPVADTLEDWGDEEPVAGYRVLRQPSMTAMYGSPSLGDVLLTTARAAGLGTPVAAAAPVEPGATAPVAAAAPAGGLGFGPATWREYVAAHWQGKVWDGSGAFPDFWEGSLVRGFVTSAVDANTFVPTVVTTALPLTEAPVAGQGDVTLVSYPHPHRGDGRYANQPWAQEMSDPLTGVTWDSWLEIGADLAQKLGVVNKDGEFSEVEVQGPAGQPVKLAAVILRSVKGDVATLAFGQGHTAMGRYANGYGVNAAKLRPVPAPGQGWAPVKVSVRTTGAMQKLATTFSVYGTTDEHRHFGVHVDAGKLAQVGDAPVAEGDPAGELCGLHEIGLDERLQSQKIEGFYNTPDHPNYRFGMTVDTNACTGCWSCSIACYAENNLPVVGKDQVRRGREMQWLRINRYWQEDLAGSGQDDVQFVPMLCQHCGHAGCENVCPVLATYHNIDGLNAMVYNRCVGTRYCSNACPYSVRRFNYHTFAWPEPFNLQLNPDVSVREMGVMEKCTFCVQRIRSVKSAWKDHAGFTALVPDDELRNLPACVEACPTGALTFGNLRDPESTISKARRSPRTYQPLEDLRTLSAINYLAKASFHHDPTADHHGGHGEGGHGAEGGHEAPAEPGHEQPAQPAHEEG
jgi:molybdopterin-containing oxidoreductase family iron-sulfur binding subunit